mgnify:CR=1 FL=1
MEQEFDVEIKEVLSRVQKVKAESLDDAINKAMDMYYAEQIVLGAEDMKGVDFAPISEGQLPSSLKYENLSKDSCTGKRVQKDIISNRRKSKMKSDSTTVIKNMEFLVKELHKEWDRSGASKASVIISIEEVDGINDKIKEIIYQTQKSVDEDELTFKQSIAKSKECYVLLRVVRKIAKKKDKCEKQAIDNEFAIELDKDELKVLKGLFAEMFK